MTRAPHLSLNLSAGIAAVSVSLALVGLKLWALTQTGSLSVAASLADSAIDLLTSLAGLATLVYAAKPADEDHAFGHSSAEDLFALGQAAMVTASALLIGWRAMERLASPHPPPLSSEKAGLVVMLAAIALTGALVWWQRRVARRTGSRVVASDSLHYLSDLLPNFGAVAALAASAWLGLHDLDAIVALAAVAILLVGAARIARGAFDALMDRAAPPELMAQVEAIAAEQPGALGIHDLKTRTAGARVFIQLHVELDPEQSLRDAHAIGFDLRRRILDRIPDADVIIHLDPVDDPDDP